MINTLFIEKDLREHPRTKIFLEKLKHKQVQEIEDYLDIFGAVKKPYLKKRTELNAFIAKKKGQLIKEAPAAYGQNRGRHYYFIHAYNCIYECEYCYLQGFFHSPDLVFFINHEEIISQMKEIIEQYPGEEIWFHAGEFSDSLALSHVTGELPLYFSFFAENKNAYLELRTKSVNIAPLQELSPLKNVLITFSLSPQEISKRIDQKTPPTKLRLKAIHELYSLGHSIGIHFDPIVYTNQFREDYQKLIEDLANILPLNEVGYFSTGVVRFTKNVYHQVKKNYPESVIHQQELLKSFDGKMRYSRPMRLWMLGKITDLLLEKNAEKNQIYLCMEEDIQEVLTD